MSLLDFVRTDALVMELDATVSGAFSYCVRQDESSVGNAVAKLQFFGLKTIADIRNALQLHRAAIVKLSQRWAEDGNPDEDFGDPTMPEGVSLFYLCHVLAGASQKQEVALRYLEEFSIGGLGNETREDIANDLLHFMKPAV